MCTWPDKSLHLLEEGQNHPIVRFACLCHMIGRESIFVSFFYIKLLVLLDLGVEIALYNVSAVAYYKVDLIK
jgi:hypothetical protein